MEIVYDLSTNAITTRGNLMLKFLIIKEDDTRTIQEFKTLKAFLSYTKKNYIKKIKTLDEDKRYSYHELTMEEK